MNQVERLAKQLTDLDARISGMASTPSLAYSSIEDGAVDAYDADGNIVMSIGTQFDGTHAAVSLSGPLPPTPTTPVVVPGILSLTVQWDGLFLGEDGLVDPLSFAPSDFTRVEVHVSADPAFKAETAETLRGTIETPRGADVVITPIGPLPDGSAYYIRMVTRTLSGNASAPSAAAAGIPAGAIDQAALRDELDQLDRDIAQVGSSAQGALDNAMRNVATDLDALGDALTQAGIDNQNNLDTALQGVADDLVDLNQTITLARTEPITDERFSEGSLSVWPFMQNTIPAQSIGAHEIADFSLVVKKFKTDRHQLY